MFKAGVGVVSVSWYPPGLADEHGPQSDNLVPTLLRLAAEYHLRVCLHIEPYENRTVENLREHLAYVNRVYGSHPAYYRMRRGGQAVELPVFYVYDSYRTGPQQWARLFSSKGRAVVSLTCERIFLYFKQCCGSGLIESGFGYLTVPDPVF
jgi:glycoprotein endo-alpha-1,2-mannosidase